MNCYLVKCKGSRQEVKRQLISCPEVFRITDHETHLKVLCDGNLPAIPGINPIMIKDQTKHWDEKYWDFATEIFRYSMAKGHDRQGLDVVVHYLCNLWGYAEPEYYAYLVAKRNLIDKTTSETDGQDWERDALRGTS